MSHLFLTCEFSNPLSPPIFVSSTYFLTPQKCCNCAYNARCLRFHFWYFIMKQECIVSASLFIHYCKPVWVRSFFWGRYSGWGSLRQEMRRIHPVLPTEKKEAKKGERRREGGGSFSANSLSFAGGEVGGPVGERGVRGRQPLEEEKGVRRRSSIFSRKTEREREKGLDTR